LSSPNIADANLADLKKEKNVEITFLEGKREPKKKKDDLKEGSFQSVRLPLAAFNCQARVFCPCSAIFIET